MTNEMHNKCKSDKIDKGVFDKIWMFLRVWFINEININFISYVIQIEKVWICKISVKNIVSWKIENNESYLTKHHLATVFPYCFWILITNIRDIKLIFEIKFKKYIAAVIEFPCLLYIGVLTLHLWHIALTKEN